MATICLCLGRVRLKFCSIGSQPPSQLQLASQPAMWQNINLSGFRLVRQLVAGRWGTWPHWVPAFLLVPLGEWPTWPKPGKWHKWALQPILYLWHYIQGPFAVLYLHHLITYSCMQCREMLYGLCSLQTNLLISFHHQSDVLLHQGTTFEELLLSSEIGNAMEKIWTKVSLSKWISTILGNEMSLPGVWVLHLTKGQSAQSSIKLAMRCL